MSEIVKLNLCLAAPQIMNDLLESLCAESPEFVQIFAGLEVLPIIKECAQKALENLASLVAGDYQDFIQDYHHNRFKKHGSQEIIGAIATVKLSNGLGVVVNDDGKIDFMADKYYKDWREEIIRLRRLFETAYIAEINKAIMTILGYSGLKVQQRLTDISGQDELVISLEGEKS